MGHPYNTSAKGLGGLRKMATFSTTFADEEWVGQKKSRNVVT
jgi:hypothetical protein